MNNNLSRIKEKIYKGDLVVGTAISLSDIRIPEVLSVCGFDFFWIDGEHSAINKKELDSLVMVTSWVEMLVFNQMLLLVSLR